MVCVCVWVGGGVWVGREIALSGCRKGQSIFSARSQLGVCMQQNGMRCNEVTERESGGGGGGEYKYVRHREIGKRMGHHFRRTGEGMCRAPGGAWQVSSGKKPVARGSELLPRMERRRAWAVSIRRCGTREYSLEKRGAGCGRYKQRRK
jgi:hypothetical protein